MDSAGMVVGSEGNSVDVLVHDPGIELGSILRIGDHYGIVAGMQYLEDEKIGGRQKLIARTQIFGRLEGGRLRKVKRPVKPHERVRLAGVEELEGILSSDDTISFGNVYGTGARAYVKAGEYDRHIAVLASTGSGKSFLTANLVKEFSLLGLPIVIVDTHGEYLKLLAKLGEDHQLNVETYTVRHGRQGVKSLKIPVADLTAMDFRHFASLNDNQVYSLEVVLSRLADRKGARGYALDDVIEECDKVIALTQDKTSKTEVHEESAKALKRRMSGLKMMFKDIFDLTGTDVARLVKPYQITLIDASLATQAVRQSVISYLSKKILDGRISRVNELGGGIDDPVLFVVEEAHNYAGDKVTHSCKRQLQRIASEGRKFGVGLLVVSQKPSKIDEEILSQCNSGVYMHITNPRDKEHIKKSFECINEDIVRDLDSLDVGECIIAGAILDIPFLMCTVDRIEIKGGGESKFRFEKKTGVKTGGFDYV
ncbi:MAG: ATP-binding protein [Candidatus Altiarchaeota archaeon]